jgi:urease accessory protein
LLLGGDQVELNVEVGPNARLQLFDVAGTVAFDGRGARASWHVSIRLAPGAQLWMSGEPFVVADGADVTRSLDLVADPTAHALLREIVVLGRTGEAGGHLRNLVSIQVDEQPVCLEDTDLDFTKIRTLPGLLGNCRVMDTITALGPAAQQVKAAPDAVQFTLHRSAGTVTRHLGRDLSSSPLHREWIRQTQADR